MSTIATSFAVGDRVTPVANDDRVPAQTRGRVFIVQKVPGGSRTKYSCRAEMPGERGINFPGELLVPATDENIAAGRKPHVRFNPIADEHFVVGEIVSLKNPWKGIGTDVPFVVFKDDGRRVNIARLGGDSDRYIRFSHSGLVRRDLQWLSEQI